MASLCEWEICSDNIGRDHQFKECCRELANNIQMIGNVDDEVTSMIIEAASKSIPKMVITGNKKAVLLWNGDCGSAIKDRNYAYQKYQK